jgi:hypothetical protein
MPSLEELQEAHGGLDPFDAPIPGESLTQDPDQRLPYEKPPAHTDMQEATEDIFMRLTEEDTLDEILGLMRNEVPVEDIAQTLLFSGFREGKFNPDLMLNLIEPTMYMLLSIGEVHGIEPVLYPEEEMEDEEDAIINDDIALMNVRDLLDRKKSTVAEEGEVPAEDILPSSAGQVPAGVNQSMLDRIQQMGGGDTNG